MQIERRPALLVADAPGHIIDRIGRSWARHARSVEHHVLNTGAVSSFSICRLAREMGIVHWLDQVAYQTLCTAVRAPQVAMVHHLTDSCMGEGIAALDRCDAITTTSRLWQAKLESLTGRPVVRIPYSIDADVFCPSPHRDALRAAAGIGRRQFVIGFLGKAGANQDNRKGIDLLEAVVQAAAHRLRNISMVLVGPGWDSVAQRLRQSGIYVVQRQYKTTEETVAAYTLMDAMLVTSSEEGGPCTVLEAMACGVPVITSAVGHVREIVEDGHNGFVCPLRNTGEYLDALGRLEGDLELRQRISEEARRFVVRERADRVVIPRIDFAALYKGAVDRFQTRNRVKVAFRALPSAYLYARSLARPLLRRESVRAA